MRAQWLDTSELEALPPFLRVEEAAQILRISRSAAYEQANAWLATDGATGLPAVRIGRSIRVPRSAIERLQAVGTDDDDVLPGARGERELLTSERPSAVDLRQPRGRAPLADDRFTNGRSGAIEGRRPRRASPADDEWSGR